MTFMKFHLSCAVICLHALQTIALADSNVRLGKNLELIAIRDNSFVISQLRSPYQANGLLVINDDHYVLVDAKNNTDDAKLLYNWIKERNKNAVMTVINSHFHEDATGTNEFFNGKEVTTIASDLTNALLDENNTPRRKAERTFPIHAPQTFRFGNEIVEVFFPGHSHSPDDVVVYFPTRKILFGSCMIKAGDDLGNLQDANVKVWQEALEKLRRFPAEFVVPGHGNNYSPTLIDNTIRLLKKRH